MPYDFQEDFEKPLGRVLADLPETITVCGETYAGRREVVNAWHWDGPRDGCLITLETAPAPIGPWTVEMTVPLDGRHAIRCLALGKSLTEAVADVERQARAKAQPLAALLDWARKDSRDA